MRSLCSLVLSTALVLSATSARAQARVLLAADDPKQITQVDLAQVMASDSTRWLSVRMKGRARLALVSATNLEARSSGDAWLRALDFATRERVAAPPGPLAVCPERASFPLADSGLPELASIEAQPATTADSDLELQRALANAGIQVDLARIGEFSANNAGPYQITWFDAQTIGGVTAAVRWVDHDSTNQLPEIRVAGLDSVPVSLIALGKDAVSSQAGSEGDPSELAVTYFALAADSDYVTARASWQQNNADRWLLEAANTSAVFDYTVLGDDGEIPPAADQYFAAVTGKASASEPCAVQVRTAHQQGSKDSADFSCNGADDLAQTLSELDFADVRLTRFFGSTNAAPAFVVRPGTQQDPRLQATDFETKGCSAVDSAAPGGAATPGNGTGTGSAMSTGAGQSSGTYTSGSESSTEVDTTVSQTSGASDDSGCGVGFGIDTTDSCSGDSSSSSDSSSSDSCTGDSSSDDSSDSCSGDSSSDSSKDDSCSGDSDSSSKDDSSGCGSSDKSGYDGDTCTGNSASSTSQGLTSPHPARSHRVRLSLLTLLAAGLSLPLRRRLK